MGDAAADAAQLAYYGVCTLMSPLVIFILYPCFQTLDPRGGNVDLVGYPQPPMNECINASSLTNLIHELQYVHLFQVSLFNPFGFFLHPALIFFSVKGDRVFHI